jgi:hypothetical protein
MRNTNPNPAEGRTVMQAQFSDQSIAPAVSPDAEAHKSSHLLYQGVTVLAILLFLISFWSC